MEPIESNSVLTFVSCFVFLLMLLFIIVFFIRYGKRQLENDLINESEYEAMYLEIQDHIASYPNDLSGYHEIKKELWRLKNLKWKNKERTAVLYAEFHMGRFLNITLSERKKRIKEKC